MKQNKVVLGVIAVIALVGLSIWFGGDDYQNVEITNGTSGLFSAVTGQGITEHQPVTVTVRSLNTEENPSSTVADLCYKEGGVDTSSDPVVSGDYDLVSVVNPWVEPDFGSQAQIDLRVLTDQAGGTDFVIRQRCNDGSTDRLSHSFDVDFDTTAPSIDITAPQQLREGDQYTVTATADDPSKARSVEITAAGENERKRCGTMSADTTKTRCEATLSGVAGTGDIDVRVVAYDTPGNKEETTQTISVTRQTTDTDGDGIIDSEDDCDDEKGPESNDGCPEETEPTDTDGDGIIDDNDECPNEFANTESGCPEDTGGTDTDGDGIIDDNDACPNEAADTETGCPEDSGVTDTDGDGIIDSEDGCPRQAAQTANGCPTDSTGLSINYTLWLSIIGVVLVLTIVLFVVFAAQGNSGGGSGGMPGRER